MGTPTWQLLPDPLSDDLYSPVEAEVSEFERGTSNVIGRGVIRPFRRVNSDFQSGTGVDLIRSAVALVLGTTCSSKTTQGELPWRTEFGSLLQLTRLRNNDSALKHFAEHYIGDALLRWVPALRITSIEARPTQKQKLVLHIKYDYVDAAGTRVVIPGLETSIQVG